ncbi:SCP2 sterol-binding domain-containing protein [Candidatus Parabeggiatoa sp. HSG14]|uniref:ubiquinone biosynthesis accessory factor UbiJ n=1 Tax=Candidatus Parabeggiatoa sp. HSG14 TaxID=3055593 RepID=UPI0025A7D134|nr:SCP2 sterol-binding domain-containing protein [Thiotrichales bacterium HSG14]
MNQLFAITLETLLNQTLRLEPSRSQALSELSGKVIRIELSGVYLNFTFFPDKQGVIVLHDYHGDVDATVCAAPFTFLRLLLDRQSLLSDNPDVTISGKLEIAQKWLDFLKGLDIDWEKQLAKRLGEIPAQKLGSLFRRSQNYAHERFNTFQLKSSEYLQDKIHSLPTQSEIVHFANAVNLLHDDFERLEQRVQRLI